MRQSDLRYIVVMILLVIKVIEEAPVMSDNYDWAFKFLPSKLGSIVEVGSRDGLDAITLSKHFRALVISFEPNPTQYQICASNVSLYSPKSVVMKSEALTNFNGEITFLAIDPIKYENVGASSLFEIDFSNREKSDNDRGRSSVQVPITAPTARWDSLDLPAPDLLAMDCEGSELLALKGFGRELHKVQYIILEVSTVALGRGACTYSEVDSFLRENGFKFVATSIYGNSYFKLRFRLILNTVKRKLKKPIGKPLRGLSFDVVYKNSSLTT